MVCQAYVWLSLPALLAFTASGARRVVDFRPDHKEEELAGHRRTRIGQGFFSQRFCNHKRDFGKCESRVKSTLDNMKCEDLGDIDTCIGAVLSDNENLDTECCQLGTDYDKFVLESVPTKAYQDLVVDKHTALAIIDVQKDFTQGSFAQPCWASGGGGFVNDIVGFMNKVAQAGGTIIASKDTHTHNHCSFAGKGPCKNQKDYTKLEFTPDQRYVNEFPSHCTFSPGKKYVEPDSAPDTPFCMNLKKLGVPLGDEHFCNNKTFKGLAFDEQLARNMGKLDPGKVEVVFKAFHDDYDSFSAMPHLAGGASEEEQKFTGGYALPKARAAKCHGKWDKDPRCYPTLQELAEPTKRGMRSALNILNDNNITRLYTVGLVFDFCVKETAIFAKEAAAEGKWNAADATSAVIGQLSRPSFDGKPGAPYVGMVCDGGAADGSFCTQGGGTRPLFDKVKEAFTQKGVEFFRYEPKKCADAPKDQSRRPNAKAAGRKKK